MTIVNSSYGVLPTWKDGRPGRALHTIGRLTSAVELLMLAYKGEQFDGQKSRADTLYELAERITEIAGGMTDEAKPR